MDEKPANRTVFMDVTSRLIRTAVRKSYFPYLLVALGSAIYVWLVPQSTGSVSKPVLQSTGDVSKPAAGQGAGISVRSSAGPSVKIGDQVRVSIAFMGCKTTDDLARVEELAIVGKDIEAALKYGYAHSCIVLERGATASVESHSLWAGAECIRQPGEPECVWTPEKFLVKTAPR